MCNNKVTRIKQTLHVLQTFHYLVLCSVSLYCSRATQILHSRSNGHRVVHRTWIAFAVLSLLAELVSEFYSNQTEFSRSSVQRQLGYQRHTRIYKVWHSWGVCMGVERGTKLQELQSSSSKPFCSHTHTPWHAQPSSRGVTSQNGSNHTELKTCFKSCK